MFYNSTTQNNKLILFWSGKTYWQTGALLIFLAFQQERIFVSFENSPNRIHFMTHKITDLWTLEYFTLVTLSSEASTTKIWKAVKSFNCNVPFKTWHRVKLFVFHKFQEVYIFLMSHLKWNTGIYFTVYRKIQNNTLNWYHAFLVPWCNLQHIAEVFVCKSLKTGLKLQRAMGK